MRLTPWLIEPVSCSFIQLEHALLLQEYQVIVDHPQQLDVLQNLMERGKLTEKQCEQEKLQFVEYVRDTCKKISLLSRHCIVAGMLPFYCMNY